MENTYLSPRHEEISTVVHKIMTEVPQADGNGRVLTKSEQVDAYEQFSTHMSHSKLTEPETLVHFIMAQVVMSNQHSQDEQCEAFANLLMQYTTSLTENIHSLVDEDHGWAELAEPLGNDLNRILSSFNDALGTALNNNGSTETVVGNHINMYFAMVVNTFAPRAIERSLELGADKSELDAAYEELVLLSEYSERLMSPFGYN